MAIKFSRFNATRGYDGFVEIAAKERMFCLRKRDFRLMTYGFKLTPSTGYSSLYPGLAVYRMSGEQLENLRLLFDSGFDAANPQGSRDSDVFFHAEIEQKGIALQDALKWARERKKAANPPAKCKKWSKEEVVDLSERWVSGETATAIAKELGYSVTRIAYLIEKGIRLKAWDDYLRLIRGRRLTGDENSASVQTPSILSLCRASKTKRRFVTEEEILREYNEQLFKAIAEDVRWACWESEFIDHHVEGKPFTKGMVRKDCQERARNLAADVISLARPARSSN